MENRIDISNYIYVIMMIFVFLCSALVAQENDFKKQLNKTFKFSTFYAAANGGTSISDQNIYSVLDGLQTNVVETPFDYSVSLGLRKIARFGYENRANTFYDGTENTYSDAATIGKISGLEDSVVITT